MIAGNGDGIFKRLMVRIGRADLAENPGLAGNEGRAARAEELDSAIGAWSATRSLDVEMSRRPVMTAIRSWPSPTRCRTRAWAPTSESHRTSSTWRTVTRRSRMRTRFGPTTWNRAG